MCVYIYMCMYVYMCVCVYIYIYIYKGVFTSHHSKQQNQDEAGRGKERMITNSAAQLGQET